MGRTVKRTPGLPPGTGGLWSAIANDRVRGASALSLAALDRLDRAVRARGSTPREVLARWGLGLTRAQPTMGPIQRMGAELVALAGRANPAVPAATVVAWCRRWKRHLRAERRRLVATGRRRLPAHAHILTLSRSSSVEGILRKRSGVRSSGSVVVLRSLPGVEGRGLAKSLRSAGVPVRLVADARADHELERADLVLLGADLVYSDGSMLNKIGSRRLARRAHALGIPTIVVTGSSKAIARPPPRRPLRPEVFDLVPARWITTYWTERGAYAPQQIARSITSGIPGTR